MSDRGWLTGGAFEDAADVGVERVLGALERLRAADLRAMRALPAVHGLTASDVAALRFIADRVEAGDPAGPKEIAEHLALSSSAVTTLLDRLQAHGSATVEPHPVDRRRKMVRTVPSAFVEPVDHDVHAFVEEMTSRSRRIVADFLARVADSQDARTRRRES